MHSAILAGSGDPNSFAARSRLVLEQAVAALCAGDQMEAERTLRNHLLHAPGDAEALAKLADIASGDRRMEEATLLLRRAAAADPTAPRQFALARHLLAFAGPAVALAEIESLPASCRSTFEIRAFEATLLGMLRQHQRQLALLEELSAERPADAVLWVNRANALNSVGRADEAVTALRKAIELEPSCGAAYWTLANLKSWRFTDADVAAMDNTLRGRLSDVERLNFEFALGRALEQRQAYAESFEHYAAGNRMRAAELQPEEMRVTAFVDEAIAAFDQELTERRAGTGCQSSEPIFVIGLHRSGSTLIEQILASHPMIEGAGELPVLQQIWERIARAGSKGGRSPFDELSEYDSATLKAIGAEYLERTRPFRLTGRPHFVDKLPANWLNVGLIRLALPNAKIIDARRNPLACGFSNFKQNYAIGVNYSYSLGSIGRFYRDYLRLMDHFDRVQPGAIHHVVNERLIEEPEQEIRRMLDFLGLHFDAACLDFHRNERAVNTPSAQQVRRPLNRDGVDTWRGYEPWLDPLKDALGPALENWLPA